MDYNTRTQHEDYNTLIQHEDYNTLKFLVKKKLCEFYPDLYNI